MFARTAACRLMLSGKRMWRHYQQFTSQSSLIRGPAQTIKLRFFVWVDFIHFTSFLISVFFLKSQITLVKIILAVVLRKVGRNNCNRHCQKQETGQRTEHTDNVSSDGAGVYVSIPNGCHGDNSPPHGYENVWKWFNVRYFSVKD